jgi:hypothetical protein
VPVIVETAAGPVLQIPAGPALEVAASIRRLLALRPEWAGRDLLLSFTRDLLLRVEDRHARGVGFAPETASHSRVFDWRTAAEVAQRTGETPQAVTQRCRLGQIAGAHKVAGHGWFIPVDIDHTTEPPDHERGHDDNPQHDG